MGRIGSKMSDTRITAITSANVTVHIDCVSTFVVFFLREIHADESKSFTKINIHLPSLKKLVLQFYMINSAAPLLG